MTYKCEIKVDYHDTRLIGTYVLYPPVPGNVAVILSMRARNLALSEEGITMNVHPTTAEL